MSVSEQRMELIKTILEDEVIAEEEEEVLHRLLSEHISRDLVSDRDKDLTFGQKAADGVAKFAGSWTFLILFFGVLLLWIAVNTVFLAKPFDIYPFILLNLILSCVAAVQAPIIMMSQNRQEDKDRIRAKNDYKVNLKAEIIIEDIHHKLDAIIENQQLLTERMNAAEQSITDK